MRLIELTGRRFGRLVATRYVGDGRWECQCDCGTTKIARGQDLRSEHTTTCGCRERIKSLVGIRFGRVVVTGDSGWRTTDGNVIWKYLCDCGRVATTRGANLTRGATRSCGCAQVRQFDRKGRAFCPHCQEWKRPSAFRSIPRGGIDSYCHDCYKRKCRDHYKVNKDALLLRAKIWYRQSTGDAQERARSRPKKRSHNAAAHLKKSNALARDFLSDRYVRVARDLRLRHQEVMPELIELERTIMAFSRRA